MDLVYEAAHHLPCVLSVFALILAESLQDDIEDVAPKQSNEHTAVLNPAARRQSPRTDTEHDNGSDGDTDSLSPSAPAQSGGPCTKQFPARRRSSLWVDYTDPNYLFQAGENLTTVYRLVTGHKALNSEQDFCDTESERPAVVVSHAGSAARTTGKGVK
ncbi:hypothetical protein B0H14DRAFT_3151665 [Mycena olivaceomarginata]|nr:hypothetical protein B0H14DRAFT_3151665 [Mycena olivaceomarginata]